MREPQINKERSVSVRASARSPNQVQKNGYSTKSFMSRGCTTTTVVAVPPFSKGVGPNHSCAQSGNVMALSVLSLLNNPQKHSTPGNRRSFQGMSIYSKKKYLVPWVLAVHTKLFMNSWRFSTEGGDVLMMGSQDLVGQPTSVMYICGLLGNVLAKSTPVRLKELNDHVAASWMRILACQACTLTILEEGNKND